MAEHASDDTTTDALERLPHATLAALGREYLLFGHLVNRASLPWVHVELGAEARERIAIEEWMGASPVYTQRMQRAMGFAGGDDVETIFKALQLDVGFAHQYMDVRYALESRDRGSFWLPSCGALLELEQHGPDAVRSMCHAIEDPTFDATAVATNPLARVRPVHRPPRVPADRMPHCHWNVFIEHGGEPVREIPLTGRVRQSRLASFAFPEPEIARGGGGRDDYAGAFVPAFELELLSRRALVIACREFLVQSHLLVRALMTAVAELAGDDAARSIGVKQWTGAGAVAATRLRAALGVTGDDAKAIADVLRLHPSFVPGYTEVGIDVIGPDRLRIRLDDCEALREADPYHWYALLDADPHPALEAMAQAVNPQARCRAVTSLAGARRAWEIVIDLAAAAPAERPEVAIVAAANTARFVFRPGTAAA